MLECGSEFKPVNLLLVRMTSFSSSMCEPLLYFYQETPEDGGWHDLVAKGYIEYIDTEEEETTMISMTINVSIQTMVSVW